MGEKTIGRELGMGLFFGFLLSAVLSFSASLSTDSYVVDVTAGFCPESHQDIFLCDDEERELASEYRIVIEKNVIFTEPSPEQKQVLTGRIKNRSHYVSVELTQDIFYPPKTIPTTPHTI